MRDATITALAIGGSEVAALVGLDPNRDAFAIYAEKLGLVEREPPTPRMRMGRRLEKIIAEVYAEETGQAVAWHDETQRNSERPWQAYTIDAFVLAAPPMPDGINATSLYPQLLPEDSPIGLIDCKCVSWDQAGLWGDAGTDEVPDRIACQAAWYMDATSLPWCDIAALFGGTDLKIYRLHYDANIADVLRGAAEEFVKNHLEPQVPPPIGHSDTAARYLKQKFPKPVQNIRRANDDETMLLARYKTERQIFAEAKARKDDVEMEVKQAIGDCEGIDDPVLGKVTFKFVKPTEGPDWKEIARHLYEETLAAGQDRALREYEDLYRRTVREGFRRISVPKAWKAIGEEE